MLPNRCIIVGGGSSITEGLQKGLIPSLQNECVFVINFAYHDFPATINIFADHEFYLDNKENLDKCGLVIGKNTPKFGKIYPIGNNLILLEPAGRYFGKQSLKKGVYSGALSGLFALTTAISLGFQEIFLLGFDFCAINGKTHYYQDDGRGLGMVRKEAGEPGAYRETSGVGFELSEPSLFKTGCYNRPAEELFNVYHPFEFIDVDLNEIEWLEILRASKELKSEISVWQSNYFDFKQMNWIQTLPNRIKERDDYIAFHEFKKMMVKVINEMVYDLGMERVTEIFYPSLCEWYGLRKELQGIKIYNVSPLSKIHAFPKMSYKDFFNYLKENPIHIFQNEVRNDIKQIIGKNQ